MSHSLRQLFIPSRVWPLAALLATGIIVLAAVVTPAAEPLSVGRPKMDVFCGFSCPRFEPVTSCNKAGFYMPVGRRV
jgi:hypothetical protein